MIVLLQVHNPQNAKQNYEHKFSEGFDRGMSIGKRIEYLRLRQRMSQKDLAEVLELDRSTISKIEKGDRKIWAQDIEKLSARFDIPPGWFYSETEDEPQDRDLHEEIVDKLKLILEKLEAIGIFQQNGRVIPFPRQKSAHKLSFIDQPVGAGRTLADCPVTGEITVNCSGKPTHAFLVKGTSMEPEVPNGSLVLVRALGIGREGRWKDKDLCVIYLADEDEWTVKKVLKYDERFVMLIGNDGTREKREIARIMIQGVVQDVVRKPDRIEAVLDSLKEAGENYQVLSKERNSGVKRNEYSGPAADTDNHTGNVTIIPSLKERVGSLEESKTEKKLDQIIELMRMQVGLLEEVKKNAEQNEVLAAVNYLLERGEISAQQAESRLKSAGINPKKFLK